MSTRPYTSSVRTAAAAEKRERVIAAAARSLREDASIASFSLDAVAKAAGVTRLTVYHHRARREAVDMILALASFAVFAMLYRDRSVDDVCAPVKTAYRSALDPLFA